MNQFALAIVLSVPTLCFADWPQAAGPNHQYVVEDGKALTEFSVARNEGVIWRTPLPNTGESTPIVFGNRIFLTCHTPMKADAESGQAIYGMCFDVATGKELWRRELPATRETDMASGFSDNTAASPVTDGRHVCFINVGGSVRTYDFDGNLLWKYDWVPFGRHHARQQEPILYDGKVIFLKTVATDLKPSMTTKAGAKPLGRDRKYWTHLHAFELATGKVAWVAEAGTSVHSASLFSRTADGTPAILTGRGGGHEPPEDPYGMSLINADTGKTIWELPIKGYAAHQNCSWQGNEAAAFVGMAHHRIDVATGTLRTGTPLNEYVRLRQFSDGKYRTLEDASPPNQGKKATTYHTDIRIGDYHYFRTHKGFLIGRVKLSTGAVEYLQVPVQVKHDGSGEPVRVWDWDGSQQNDVRNNDGFIVYQDKRATLHGWGHVSAASPIVIGDYLYAPTMLGTVYVLRWNAEALDESALVSVSDLGPAGKTWSLSSLAYSEGRLYARTMKELICIGAR
jgi:outer membrane protein assembly factor BamB